MAAVALLPRQEIEFSVLFKGAAEKVLEDSLLETNEIFCLEMFAMVAAVVALGEQLRGKRMFPLVGSNAASGALIKAIPGFR